MQVADHLQLAKLDPDGNCLGVALRDAWRLAGLAAPGADLAVAFRVRDAISILRQVRPPKLLVRKGASLVETVAIRLAASRYGVRAHRFEDLEISDVILCLRTMRQLYGLKHTAGGHWVCVIKETADCFSLIDRLWDGRVELVTGVRRSTPERLLSGLGPSIVV